MLGLQEHIPYVVPWRSDETVSDQIKMQMNEVDSFTFLHVKTLFLLMIVLAGDHHGCICCCLLNNILCISPWDILSTRNDTRMYSRCIYGVLPLYAVGHQIGCCISRT